MCRSSPSGSIDDSSTAGTRRSPWSCAAACASGTPSTVSWSLSARSSTPAAAAAATTLAGVSAPSEYTECDCRSNVGAATAARLERGEGLQSPRPRGVEVGAAREAPVELEDRHPVGEGPQGPRGVAVPAGGPERGQRGAVLGAGHEELAVERTGGHEPVEVRVLAGEGAVAAGQLVECRPVERRGELLEPVGDHRRLQRVLAGEVLVDRGRPDAEALPEAPHRQRLGSFLLEQLTRGGDDLPRARL